MSDTQTREDLAAAYGSDAAYATMTTADPGAEGSAPASEVPGMTRQPLTWTAGPADGAVTASATFDIPANTSMTHAVTTDAATGGRIIDKVAAVYNSQPSAGQVTVNFTYTQG